MNVKKCKKAGLLSIMLAIILMPGGCQYTETQKIQNDESSSNITKNTADVDTLVVTYQTSDGSVTKDLDEVLEEINKITEKKIGVKVSFEVSAAVTAGKDYPLWISEGKKIDLMLINYQDITSYINYGLIQPLDSLLEEDGTEITRLVEEGYYLTEGTIIDGKTYGVGIASSDVGTCYGIWIPKSYLNAVDFQYEKDHVYDWEELTGLFEQLKKKYPDAYPLGQITSSNFFSNAQFYGLQAAGNVPVDSEGIVYNYFAQEEYYQFLIQMHRWYEQGFIYEDAGFTDATQLDLIRSGKILSFPFLGNPGNTGDFMFKEPCVCLRTSEVTYNHRGSVGVFWTIPKTSAHPNEAMKFLNLLYEDTELSNLIQYGIEKNIILLPIRSTGKFNCHME